MSAPPLGPHSHHHYRLPDPPPSAFSSAFRQPLHNTHHVRDLSLSTITTYIKHDAGKPQEISCIGLRDLILGFQPRCMDTSCLDRLSFKEWVKSVAEDMARETHRSQLFSRNWHIHVVIKTETPGRERLMLDPPNERGFRAALKRNFDLTPNFAETDVTFILSRLTNEELVRRSREINHVKAHLPRIRASVDYAGNALLKTPANVDQPCNWDHDSSTFPPPGPYNTPPLLDIILATITTVIELGDGRQKEVSCATLRDLLSDFGLEPIPMSIDASWIARLSYAKWATAVVEDMASRLHEEIRPHEGWEIWIPTQWQHLQVFPNDRGFRAAIAKWLTWHSEDFDMDVTIFMKKLSNGKK